MPAQQSGVRRRALSGGVVAASVALVGVRRQALTVSGGLAGWFSGAIVTAGGLDFAAAMLTFFLSGSVLSQRKLGRQKVLAATWDKGSRRDAAQVAANGGVATLAALIYIWRATPPIAAACFGSLAASTADTWATEVGVRSSATPRRITDWQTLETGVSGGVTAAGLMGSVLGASFLAGVAVARSRGGRPPRRLYHFLGIAVAGVCGSLFDSFLGATVQASRTCSSCGEPTEQRIHHCGTPTVLQHGYGWLDNDMVNLLCAGAGAIIALLWEIRLPQRGGTSL